MPNRIVWFYEVCQYFLNLIFVNAILVNICQNLESFLFFRLSLKFIRLEGSAETFTDRRMTVTSREMVNEKTYCNYICTGDNLYKQQDKRTLGARNSHLWREKLRARPVALAKHFYHIQACANQSMLKVSIIIDLALFV